jgi:hypothetical protein
MIAILSTLLHLTAAHKGLGAVRTDGLVDNAFDPSEDLSPSFNVERAYAKELLPSTDIPAAAQKLINSAAAKAKPSILAVTLDSKPRVMRTDRLFANFVGIYAADLAGTTIDNKELAGSTAVEAYNVLLEVSVDEISLSLTLSHTHTLSLSLSIRPLALADPARLSRRARELVDCDRMSRHQMLLQGAKNSR